MALSDAYGEFAEGFPATPPDEISGIHGQYDVPTLSIADNPSHTGILNRIRYGLDATILGLEISPANEAARWAVFGASQTISSNPIAGAIAYGGATLLVEGAAAITTADLLSAGKGKKAMDKLHDRVSAFVPEDATELPKLAEYSIGLVLGSGVVMGARETVAPDPERGFMEHLRYGMSNVVRVTGICAVQGAALNEGIHSPSPATIGLAVGAMGGGAIAARRVIRRWRNNSPVEGI